MCLMFMYIHENHTNEWTKVVLNITVKFQHYRRTRPMPIVTIPVSHVIRNFRFVCCVINIWRHMSVYIDVQKSAREKPPAWDWQKTAVEKKSMRKWTTVVRIVFFKSKHVSVYVFNSFVIWLFDKNYLRFSYIWILCLAK